MVQVTRPNYIPSTNNSTIHTTSDLYFNIKWLKDLDNNSYNTKIALYNLLFFDRVISIEDGHSYSFFSNLNRNIKISNPMKLDEIQAINEYIIHYDNLLNVITRTRSDEILPYYSIYLEDKISKKNLYYFDILKERYIYYAIKDYILNSSIKTSAFRINE